MTDFDLCERLENRLGELAAKAAYASFDNPDGTAPADYQEYARLWGHPSHKIAVAGLGHALAA